MTFNLKGGFVALALLASVLPAAAAPIEYTLINNSSQSLHFFYTAPSSTAEWGDDLLGETGTLESGQSGTVTIANESDECLYDLRFETGEGATVEALEVDICQLATYTLND